MRQPVLFTILAVLCFASVPEGPASAALLDGPAWQASGDSASDGLGFAVASVPDLNGDGFGDVVVGARLDDVGAMVDAGTVSVFSGATGALLWKASGDTANDQFGFSVGGTADVNSDGLGDVIVGSVRDDPSGRIDAGTVSVLSGATGALIWKAAGDTAGDLFGFAVAGVPDVNADGAGDVIIGSTEDDAPGISASGSASVYNGRTGALIWKNFGTAVNDHVGSAVAGVPDLNGDGRGDVAIGAPEDDVSGRTNCGSVFVRSGTTGALVWTLAGDTAGDRLGCSVAGVDDFTGDGRGDVVVGANLDDPGGRLSAGSAYALSGFGGSLVWQAKGAVAGDNLGWSVAGVPDADGDGAGDVLLGTPFPDISGKIDCGQVHLMSGVDGTLIWEADGVSAGDAFGQAVAGIEDLDGDALGDLAVGASGDDVGSFVDAGTVYVYGTFEETGDTTAPEVTCPGELTAEATGPGGAVVTFSVVATDDSGVPPTVVCSPESGSIFPLGSTTVECTATDGAGNTDTCSFTVIVVDTTPPMVSCPESVELEATGPGGASFEWEVEAEDIADTDPTITSDYASGATFPIGTTTVTVTATDASGNEGTCSFDVTVSDTTPPAVDASVAIDLLWPPNNGMYDVGLTTSASDSTDEAPAVHVSVYSDEAGGSGAFAEDAVITEGQLSLRAERAGSGDGRVYLIIATATDASGNTAVDVATVVVPKAHSADKIASANAQATDAKATALSTGAPPSGWYTLLP